MILNKKKIFVIGSGGHSRPVIENLKMLGKNKINLFDIKFSKNKENSVLGVKVLDDFKSINLKKIKKKTNFYIAIGENKLRKKYFKYLKKFVVLPNLKSKKSFISPNSKIGKANFFNHFSFLGPNTKIGNNNILNTYSLIEHDVDIGDNCHICPGVKIGGRTKIGDNVFIGIGSVIINNIKICSNVTIGAGSLIYKNIIKPGTYINQKVLKLKK
tara:strand:+ start:118 stop:759 length:642 start_codon:yes stop_codon:yes gene_type:complete